jgi:hypothetical protein
MPVSGPEYHAWEDLFTVIAEPDASEAIRALAPGISSEKSVREIALKFIREVTAASSNENAYRVLNDCIETLISTLGPRAFQEYERLAELLRRDTSGAAAGAWAWMEIARRWSTDEVPRHSSLTDRTMAIIRPVRDADSLEDPLDWQSLVEGAQAKLVATAVAEYLAALPSWRFHEVIEDARRTARALGIPADLIRDPKTLGTHLPRGD